MTKTAPYILRGREMVTHRPHKPEILGSSPSLRNHKGIFSKPTLVASLAHMVEQLSVKQWVVGSSPTICTNRCLVNGQVVYRVGTPD